MPDKNIAADIPKQDIAVSVKNEKRVETRYPCIGIPLLYSPVESACVKDVSRSLHKAIAVNMSLSGLAFDVDKSMCVGDALCVSLESHDGRYTDEFISEVRWCKKLSNERYRVGISLNPLTKNKCNQQCDSSGKFLNDVSGRPEVPKEIEGQCEGCKKSVIFKFVSYQPVLADSGVMPLYDCSSCGTTRSFMGIIGDRENT